MTNQLFAGFVYTDAGAVVVGATVDLLTRNTLTPVLATTTTDANGYWAISYATEGRFDVRITNGSSIRFIKYDDSVQLETVETAVLRIRNPADTFDYDIVPAAIVADRQLNLPLITGTDTLMTLGLAQTVTGQLTLSAALLAADGTVSLPGYSFSGDPDTGLYRIGANNLGLALGGLRVWDYAAAATGVRYASADAVAYELAGYKARGTVAVPTVITTGDDLLRIAGYGYGGASGYVQAAEILLDSAGVIADTQVGGRIVLRTATTAAPSVLTDRLIIDNVGLATFSGPVSVTNATDSTSGSTGSIYTAGGVGITKSLVVAGAGPHVFGGSLAVSTQVRITGSFTPASGSNAYGLGLDGGSINPLAGGDAAFIFAGGTLQKAGSGAHGDFSGLQIGTPIVGANAGSTLANAQTLLVNGVPTGATTNMAARFKSGVVQLQNLQVGAVDGTLSTNNQLTTGSQGAASTTLYIGNASINVTSDARAKTNRLPYMGDALALLRQLPVQEYDYLEGFRPMGGVYTSRYVGFTAQDAYRVAPWAINTQGGRDCPACLAGEDCTQHPLWQLKGELFLGLQTRAIQQLDARITALGG